jgi:hypothetical protein
MIANIAWDDALMLHNALVAVEWATTNLAS